VSLEVFASADRLTFSPLQQLKPAAPHAHSIQIVL
jgi:hypothetical protein